MSKQKQQQSLVNEKLRISASRCNTYLHCGMEYFFTYHEHLQPKESGARPLFVGALVHRLKHQFNIGKLNLEALADYGKVVQKLFPEIANDQEAISIASEALTLFSGFVNEFKDDPLTVVSSETHLELDRGDYILYTRVDELVRTQDEKLWRGEHKTTARIDNAYLKGLKRGIQAGIADIVLSKVMPEKIWGTMYNLLVKTKVPQYYRSPILTEKNLRPMTESMLKYVHDGITNERFGCSMDCFVWNRECKFLPLCKHDSPQIREAFYKYRPDEIPTSEGEEDEV